MKKVFPLALALSILLGFHYSNANQCIDLLKSEEVVIVNNNDGSTTEIRIIHKDLAPYEHFNKLKEREELWQGKMQNTTINLQSKPGHKVFNVESKGITEWLKTASGFITSALFLKNGVYQKLRVSTKMSKEKYKALKEKEEIEGLTEAEEGKMESWEYKEKLLKKTGNYQETLFKKLDTIGTLEVQVAFYKDLYKEVVKKENSKDKDIDFAVYPPVVKDGVVIQSVKAVPFLKVPSILATYKDIKKKLKKTKQHDVLDPVQNFINEWVFDSFNIKEAQRFLSNKYKFLEKEHKDQAMRRFELQLLREELRRLRIEHIAKVEKDEKSNIFTEEHQAELDRVEALLANDNLKPVAKYIWRIKIKIFWMEVRKSIRSLKETEFAARLKKIHDALKSVEKNEGILEELGVGRASLLARAARTVLMKSFIYGVVTPSSAAIFGFLISPNTQMNDLPGIYNKVFHPDAPIVEVVASDPGKLTSHFLKNSNVGWRLATTQDGKSAYLKKPEIEDAFSILLKSEIYKNQQEYKTHQEQKKRELEKLRKAGIKADVNAILASFKSKFIDRWEIATTKKSTEFSKKLNKYTLNVYEVSLKSKVLEKIKEIDQKIIVTLKADKTADVKNLQEELLSVYEDAIKKFSEDPLLQKNAFKDAEEILKARIATYTLFPENQIKEKERFFQEWNDSQTEQITNDIINSRSHER